jgi:hypothetical protein
MADFEPSLRAIEPAPLTPLRERQRRGQERPFDLERELDGRSGAREAADEQPAATPPDLDAPVAPRDADEAGGRLDVTA